MTYLTVGEAVQASRTAYGLSAAAVSAIRKSAATPASTWFDIFLSHSFHDAEIIAGVARLIEQDGTSVYVDWRDDPLLDRSRVTPETAGRLRERMAHCRFLLYATSPNTTNSRWMPWELGYFDGLRGGKVGILPVVSRMGETFVGQEYLGLYPRYERIPFTQLGLHLGKYTGKQAGEALTKSVRR